MTYERVLITGAGGMLGGDVYRTFSDVYNNIKATDIDTNEEWIEYLDIRDKKACIALCNSFKPQLILHLAALTDLEYCEINRDNAWATNALGTQCIAEIAVNLGATMVYVSTAGIFDGEKESYSEADLPIPINQYGKSKFYGEQYVVDNVKDYYVFRAGWMMGGGPGKDKKFIKKILSQIANGSKELFVVDDKSGTPTYTVDFAYGMLSVILAGRNGLYNQVCSGFGNRYEVAVLLMEYLELSDQITVHRVESNYFKDTYFAKRPKSEILINSRLNNLGLNKMRDWKICLKEYSSDFLDYLKG